MFRGQEVASIMNARIFWARTLVGAVAGAFLVAAGTAAQTPEQPQPKVEPKVEQPKAEQAGEKLAPPMPVTPPAPAATTVAATVNGQEIPELAVYRALLREHPDNWSKAREPVLNYLIENTLVDQYLTQLKIQIDAKEVEDRFQLIQEEAKKSKQDFGAMLKKLHLTEAELRKELTAALRWDKFVLQQGVEKVLRDYHAKNPAMFDGTQVQARHILISATNEDEGKVKIAAIKKAIEAEAAADIAKIAPGADKLTQEKERAAAILKAFGAAATKESTCPSKKQGGDLGWFPRVGAMVEPFARAAFALKPFEMSDAVKTEFGYHLILATDQKAGKETKFEDIKLFVQEVYGERLREAILTSYRPRSKITVSAPMK
jgi:peptidyl-prolyl cis-trans isomerase C